MRTERLRAALPLETVQKSAAFCGTALAVLGVAATGAVATASPAGAVAAGHASYGLGTGDVTFPVANVGGVHVSTNSVNPQTPTVCDGTAAHIDLIGDPEGGKVVTHPENCTITYMPDKGFHGEDTFAVEIHTPDGDVFVRTVHVRVGAALANTGAGDLLALAVLAVLLLAAGFVLTIGVQRAGREHSWDTIDS